MLVVRPGGLLIVDVTLESCGVGAPKARQFEVLPHIDHNKFTRKIIVVYHRILYPTRVAAGLHLEWSERQRV